MNAPPFPASVPFPARVVHFYCFRGVNSSCGRSGSRTTDPAKVTCERCRNYPEWRDASEDPRWPGGKAGDRA